MPDYRIRPAEEQERRKLRPLWREGFGDTEAFMDCYEAYVFHPDRVEVAELDGEVVTMLSVIPAVLRTRAGTSVPGGCLYGLATLRRHRNRGLGSRLLETSLHRWLRAGMDCIAVVPDTPALFPLYGRTLGAVTSFFVRETRVSTGELAGVRGLRAEPAETDSYVETRRRALRGRTWLDWDRTAADFQREICRQEGGDFFLFPDAPGCCAAAEQKGGGRLTVCELLAPEELLTGCLAGLLERMGCREASVRLPAWSGDFLGGRAEPFAMLSGLTIPEEEQAYLGFDFV